MNKIDCFEGTFKGKKYKIQKGDVFTRLTVKYLYHDKIRYAHCICNCENEIDVSIKSLLSGNTKSCGCLNKDLQMERNLKHGDGKRGNKTKLYNIWVEMRRRCNTTTCRSYKDYGGRGIQVCTEWNNFMKFKQWAYISGYIEGLSIERIDVNGNYSPLNCTWIEKREQSKNRRTSHYIEYNGKIQTISDWSRDTGISRGTILKRLNKGLNLDEVFHKSQQ